MSAISATHAITSPIFRTIMAFVSSDCSKDQNERDTQRDASGEHQPTQENEAPHRSLCQSPRMQCSSSWAITSSKSSLP